MGGRDEDRAHNSVSPGRPPDCGILPLQRLKCRAAPYRPAATKGNLRVPVLPPFPSSPDGA